MPIIDIQQGMIPIDSEFAKQLGFISSMFQDWSYLWGEPGRIVVSMIESKHPGNGAFSAFMKACDYLGFPVVVPTPFPRMQAILSHYGYKETWVDDEKFGAVELWVKA